MMRSLVGSEKSPTRCPQGRDVETYRSLRHSRMPNGHHTRAASPRSIGMRQAGDVDAVYLMHRDRRVRWAAVPRLSNRAAPRVEGRPALPVHRAMVVGRWRQRGTQARGVGQSRSERPAAGRREATMRHDVTIGGSKASRRTRRATAWCTCCEASTFSVVSSEWSSKCRRRAVPFPCSTPCSPTQKLEPDS